MKKLVQQVLESEDQHSPLGTCFVTNEAGVELLESGDAYQDEAISSLFGHIASIAADCGDYSELDSRLPGLDHVLIYILRFGFNPKHMDQLAKLESLSDLILTRLYRCLIGELFAAVDKVKSSQWLLDEFHHLAQRKRQTDSTEFNEVLKLYEEYYQLSLKGELTLVLS